MLLFKERVAVNYEVMAAVSNHALISHDGSSGMLRMWIDGCIRAGVKNMFVIALDDQVAETVANLGVNVWRTDPVKTKDKVMSNHGISALKFQLVEQILSFGYSVLLSDVDIVVLQNPFNFLYRDEDVESLSDGFDAPTAYGWDDVFDDPKMGWSRYAHGFHIFSLNSGLFYIRNNEKTINLMRRITDRLNKETAWDQAVFNQEIFSPSHGEYRSAHISLRIMNMDNFLNSKRLFQTIRHDQYYANHMPVMVHVNYHPDKFERMQSVWKRYIEGDLHALDSYPLGSCTNC